MRVQRGGSGAPPAQRWRGEIDAVKVGLRPEAELLLLLGVQGRVAERAHEEDRSVREHKAARLEQLVARYEI
eukprot:scaffold7588_cov133-Isochrysis_galbana.AAC.2